MEETSFQCIFGDEILNDNRENQPQNGGANYQHCGNLYLKEVKLYLEFLLQIQLLLFLYASPYADVITIFTGNLQNHYKLGL